ncbi:MAG: type 4a pilus biogenesis protein PilO [Candidatus Cloacimonadaceae bacterium]|jgi:Tfp pilus assembly protein PilO|nr:type 4a pilus biogenesis protein PilO [Candidatus Cloacimonadota bacterium]MDY0127069.1 type 4a pilus biogenesis protein PilO [Candidatus Cloacimonadaceae bacterium]MCB5254748.1 type 4a pilus biogenesis protein PilO [Candidatus Cloacimonadota bacterium]MCK9177875.1 type 4a pilus biogenesis protein PilO [Candidatus Cloacimonadota bacterium]MCK9242702.1 type 4a pilus biogenesis protein PilO [Candidatus Cloacimonadota bacterium]
MREKYFALIIVMLAATVAFIMLTTNSLEANLLKISRLDDKIKTTQEQLNSARIMDQELSQFARIIENSLTRIPQFSFDEINDFKATIGEMAHERKISINKMSDTNKWALPNLIETTFNLELEATYVQIGQFISDLESQDNIIKIQTLDISPAQVSDKEVQDVNAPSRYRVLLEISIFKVKKEA